MLLKNLLIGTLLLISSVANASVTFVEAQIVFTKLIISGHITKAPVLLYENNEEMNAYCNVQGRIIVIYEGMLRACENVDELAWVLGHELGHWIRRDRQSCHENEYKADKWGSRLAEGAGYNQRRGCKIVLKFGPGGNTHPDSRYRYKNIKNMCGESYG